MIQDIIVNGTRKRALVDNGCIITLIGKYSVDSGSRELDSVRLKTMKGSVIEVNDCVVLKSLVTLNDVQLGFS